MGISKIGNPCRGVVSGCKRTQEECDRYSQQRNGETCAEWVARCGADAVCAILRHQCKKYGVVTS